jgi:phospholipid-binding lipoprotein MlaA
MFRIQAARRVFASVLLAGVIVLGSGCAAMKASGTSSPTDPLEPVNRVIWVFNEVADAAITAPLARAYRFVIPEFVRMSIGNVFDNVGDVWNGIHSLLQAKPVAAATNFSRFIFNTTFGLGGFVDLASEMGLEREREDLGQTLGRWGIPAGPYLVIPFLGPSSARDAVGLVVDSRTDPIQFIDPTASRNSAQGLRILHTRAGLLDLGKVVEGASLDGYTFVRDAFLQRRNSLVYDGDPPAPRKTDPQD